ncbi:MAG TPA: ABC transporter substrate-binding protein [Trueperaceae bacterium]|nr:ABC transporter substrate-binding protein [Trueperaceae bacterium]
MMRFLGRTLAVLALVVAGVAAAQGDTIRIATSLAQNSLAPGEATGLPDATVIRTMFEGLVGFQDGELVNELAESWEANEDATVYTFHLREGVTFHDGTPFDAQAVKDYYDWVMDESSVAARARGQLAAMESVEVVDDLTVNIHLSEPNGAFVFLLATSNARIASPTSVREFGSDITRHPVGTGPFRFVSWTEGQNVIVERNPDYWGEPAQVERLEFVVVNNAATRVAMLQSGEVHYIEGLPPQLVPSIEGQSNLEVLTAPTNFLRILQLNTTKEPFTDVRVRQALNHAVDKQVLANVAYSGYATVMTAPIPASTFGHAEQPAYDYDPERARQLLAEAGYPDGFDVTVLTFTGDEYRLDGQVLQQMFSQVGVRMTLDQKERGALVDQIFLPVEENPTEAALVGASASTGDADLALTVSFTRQSFPPASNNWSFYQNDRVEELVAAGRASADPATRQAAYAEAQAIIWEEAPWVFLVSPDAIAGRAANVTGIAPAPDNTIDARGARFE